LYKQSLRYCWTLGKQHVYFHIDLLGEIMTEVKQRDGEAFDSMLRRFNRRVQQNGILSETRKRQAFEPPSALKKKKMANKKRKSKET